MSIYQLLLLWCLSKANQTGVYYAQELKIVKINSDKMILECNSHQLKSTPIVSK